MNAITVSQCVIRTMAAWRGAIFGLTGERVATRREYHEIARFTHSHRASEETVKRCSPANRIGLEVKTVLGGPDPKHISTSYVEWQNWSHRTSVRRMTRGSSRFSRKALNHCAATALNYFPYNFIKVHRTLRTSPAMTAGVTNRLWEVSDLVAQRESYEREAERTA